MAARHGGDQERVEVGEPLFDGDELSAAVDEEVLAELIAPVHLEHEAAEVAQARFAQLEQGAAFAAELAGRGHGASHGTGRCGRRRRRRGRLVIGCAAKTRQTRHQAATLTTRVGRRAARRVPLGDCEGRYSDADHALRVPGRERAKLSAG
jgi:hypothetical protein